MDESGEVVGLNDPYEQTKYVITKIEKALIQAGGSLDDVIRTRMYEVEINQWGEIGRAHGEFFRDIKPAATMVQVNSLISPELLVEIKVTAVAGEQG